jgi:hypothetical protein
MSGTSPLARLLDRAGRVFSLAGQLARTFQDEHTRRRKRFPADPPSWRSHVPVFDEFCVVVQGLQGRLAPA